MTMFGGGMNASQSIKTNGKVTFTVYADFGGDYLWSKEPTDMSRGRGRSTTARRHHISAGLAYDLEAWQSTFEQTTRIFQAEPEVGWDEFDRLGRELAGRLKRELGKDVAVWYVDRAPAVRGAYAYEI